MARWKPLPDTLDPEVREFAEQLRRLVDRSGLSLAAVSDHTGYSKTSWERYLNGRILAPKGAIVALAEVTGTSTIHLTTMWELAERAWSRAEERHDRTMEQIRISQAREALGEYESGRTGAGSSTGSGGRRAAPGPGRAPSGDEPTAAPSGHRAAPPAGGHRAGRTTAGRSAPGGKSGKGGKRGEAGKSGKGGGRFGVVLASVAGALAVIVAVAVLINLGGPADADAVKAAKPTPVAATDEAVEQPEAKSPAEKTPSAAPDVKCTGVSCMGANPQAMGCGGDLAATVASTTVGTAKVEVRYSEACGAAWARLTDAAPGDTIQISVGGKGVQNGLVNADQDAYTPMTAVAEGQKPTACAVLKASGTKGCTDES